MINPPKELSSMLAAWPFEQWGVDLVRTLPIGKGGYKFVVVIVDYFMKWVEAEALETITTWSVRNLLSKSMVCRYEIPHAFAIDNGKQFDCEPFWS